MRRALSTRVQAIPLILLMLLALLRPAFAQQELLSGVWMETANFPAASVIRFERSGDLLVGRYVQVSLPQRHFGFEVGETVIRGRLEGKVFRGAVLLKLSKDLKGRCPGPSVRWSAIEMNLVEPDKLYGRWLQSYTSPDDPCRTIGEAWQLYGLERLKVN